MTDCDHFEIGKATLGSEDRQIWDDIVTDHYFTSDLEFGMNLLMKAIGEIDLVTVPFSSPPLSGILRSYPEAMKSVDSVQWRTAMETKLMKPTNIHAWELVELPYGKRPIGNK